MLVANIKKRKATKISEKTRISLMSDGLRCALTVHRLFLADDVDRDVGYPIRYSLIY